MTNREAMEILSKIKENQEYNYKIYGIKPDEKMFTSLEMGIQALEKQEPKKPIKKKYKTVCPVCLTSLIIVERAYDIYLHEEVYQFKYCRYCGQAIDIAIEALEKQEFKGYIELSVDGKLYKTCCLVCQSEISKSMKYCSNCGQITGLEDEDETND